jgi:hypothetical protein
VGWQFKFKSDQDRKLKSGLNGNSNFSDRKSGFELKIEFKGNSVMEEKFQ